jgi:hypothetical protein
MSQIKKILGSYDDLKFEEAVSHRVHSRIFEILGYLDMVEKPALKKEDQDNIVKVEEICKVLISELHFIIEQYRDPGNQLTR